MLCRFPADSANTLHRFALRAFLGFSQRKSAGKLRILCLARIVWSLLSRKTKMAIKTSARHNFSTLTCALVLLFPGLVQNCALGQSNGVTLLAPIAVEQPPSRPASATNARQPTPGLTVDHFENLALVHNPTLGGAAALVTQQQGVLLQSGLYPNPTVGYVRSDPDQSGKSQTQGVFVSQDIVTAGKRRLAQAAARKEVENSQWQSQAQQARVLNDVRIRFYEALGAQQAVLSALDLEKIAVEGVKTAEQLLAAKVGTRPDVLQAEIQLSVVRASLRDARLRHESAWRQLAAVVGIPGMPSGLLSGNLEDDMPSLEWDALVNKLLSDSPQVKAQQAEVESAEYELRLARAQVIPNVNLQLVAQRDSTEKMFEQVLVVFCPEKPPVAGAPQRGKKSDPSATPPAGQEQKARPRQVELLLQRERPEVAGHRSSTPGADEVAIKEQAGGDLRQRSEPRMHQLRKQDKHRKVRPRSRHQPEETPDKKALQVNRTFQ